MTPAQRAIAEFDSWVGDDLPGDDVQDQAFFVLLAAAPPRVQQAYDRMKSRWHDADYGSTDG